MQSDEKVLMSEQTEPNIHVDCTSKSDQSPEQQPAARDTRWHPLHKGAPIRDDDVERVNVLKSLSLLDTDAEESFDRITQAAAATLKFPITLVSLVDKERQWFKSKVGLGVEETHRDLAFCSHVIYKDGSECLVVSDTWQDDRFKYSDLVTGDPKIRAYAGAPLLYQRDGKTYKLGTLCVIDATPREVTSEQISLLETMAKLVVAEIEVREKSLKGNASGSAVKVHLFPRRKAGDSIFPEKGRLPVKVDRQTVESMFGVPQPDAARALGISLTSLKQICRKLGISRWPYQRVVSAIGSGVRNPTAAVPPTSGAREHGAAHNWAAFQQSGQGLSSIGAPPSSPGVAVSQSGGPQTGGAWGPSPMHASAQAALTGQMALDSGTLEVLWLSTELECIFESSPFPVVGQRLFHLFHPRDTRHLWKFLREQATRGSQDPSTAPPSIDGEEEFAAQLLLYRKAGMEVTAESFRCSVQPRVVASELAQERMMVLLQLFPNSVSPLMPMGMSCQEMQTLLRRAGQYTVNDLISETDSAAISAKSSKTSGLPDVWAMWHAQIQALKDCVPTPKSPPPDSSPPERQHPSIECLNLLKKLDKHSGMRVVQNCTRLLMVPELHGNTIAVTCHVRFATQNDDISENPLGAIADWNPSEGMFLGLAGTPVMCNGTMQFRHSIGHFVPTAYWDATSCSLHLQVKRLRTENGRLKTYQSEHIVVSEQDGRNSIIVHGVISSGHRPEDGDAKTTEPFTYRLALAQVGST